MAPARHETPAGAGPPKGADTKSSTYGTRSSKRKASDMSVNGNSPEQKMSSSPSQKSTRSSDKPPPSKKRRSSANSDPVPVETPEPGSSESPERFADAEEAEQPETPDSNDVPQLTVAPASGSSGGSSPQKPFGWKEAVAGGEETATVNAAPTRGGLRGRARGPRKRGRWGWGWGRGRGKTAAGSGVSTPQVTSTPTPATNIFLNPGLRGRGRGRGRGGNGIPSRILASHERIRQLKVQYKSLALFQQAALQILANKSLERFKTERKYHETLPEHEKIQNELKEKYDAHVESIEKDLQVKLEWLERERKMDVEYEQSRYQSAVAEKVEQYLASIEERAAYIYHQRANKLPVDDLSFAGGEDGRVVKTLAPEPQVVPNVGLGPFAPVQELASLRAKWSDGDNYYEQHPANWWGSKTPKEQQQWDVDWKKRKSDQAARQRAMARRGGPKNNSRGMASAAAPTTEGDAAVPTDNAADSGDDVKADTPADDPVVVSKKAAKEKNGKEKIGKEKDVKDNKPKDYGDDSAPIPLDEFGVVVPHFSVRHANRIIMQPPVKFSEEIDEIGIRLTKTKKDNVNYRYGETPANPRRVHVDQMIRGTNAAKCTAEDFDAALVEKYKVHPRNGLPLPESQNPDEPANDWTEPIALTNPIMFIQNPRPGTDHRREKLHTSRSQPIINAHRMFKEIPRKMLMRSVLEQSGDLEEIPDPEPEEEVPEVEQVIDQDLINAVAHAEAVMQEEAIQAARAPRRAPIAPPPPPAPVSAPTTPRYDPVRDRTYRTPYANPAPAALPPPHSMNHRGDLDRLADAAQFHASLAAPQVFTMPQSPYGMPQPMPPPPPPQQMQQQQPQGQPQQPQLMPAPYGSVYSQPPPQLYVHQNARQGPPAPQGRHRELRPAPPQNRPPQAPQPPQQPQHPQGGPYYRY